MSTTPPLQFRFWHAIAKRYVDPAEHALTGGDELLYWDWDDGDEGGKMWRRVPLDKTPIKPEQSTGFPSAAGQPVYLNDIVHFTYQPGDFAWEHMDEAETRVQERMSGRPFMGQVVWLLGRFEIDCPLGADPLSPAMRFPASYAGGAEVLGNVNEHPDWRAKWALDYSWMRQRAGQ